MQEHTIVVTVLGAILAFVLSPGLFVRIPKNGSLKTVAIVHTLVFAAVFFLLQQIVEGVLDMKEGIATGKVIGSTAGAAGASNTGAVSTSTLNTTKNQVTSNPGAPAAAAASTDCMNINGSNYCIQ